MSGFYNLQLLAHMSSDVYLCRNDNSDSEFNDTTTKKKKLYSKIKKEKKNRSSRNDTSYQKYKSCR